MTARTLTYASISKPVTKTTKTVVKRKPVSVSISNKTGTKSRRLAKLFKLAPSTGFFSAVILASLLLLGFYHLVSINSSVGKGFQLKAAHAEIESLTEANKRLVVKQAEAGSINKVQIIAQQQGLVQTKQEEYLNLLHFTSR